MTQPLIVTSHPSRGVAVITMNRAREKNLLSIAMRSALSDALVSCDRDADIHCMVITGGNHCFSAGADVAEFARFTSEELKAEKLEKYWEPIRRCDTPIIAAVNGHCLGGGLELALLADIIVAGRCAIFAQPEVKLGAMPGSGATQLMPRLAGKYKAMRYLLTGDQLTAADAEALGLISEVVDDEQVQEFAKDLAVKIAGLPTMATRSIKRVVREGADLSLDQALQCERDAQLQLVGNDDQLRLMDAFLNRRWR